MRWDILDAFIEAANEIGIPKTRDFNTGGNEGVGYFEVNQKGGRRWSAARGFLKPILNRPNLTLITGAEAERVLFDAKRASGVRMRQNGMMHDLKARREIILSSGAVATPKLLQLSGIGPGALLQSFGIEVVHDSPGVGENLQDHLQIRPIYKVSGVKTLNMQYQSLFNRALMGLEYALRRTGPLTMAPFAARSVHTIEPRLCDAEPAIPRAAIILGQVWRFHARFQRLHLQRVQSPAREPWPYPPRLA